MEPIRNGSSIRHGISEKIKQPYYDDRWLWNILTQKQTMMGAGCRLLRICQKYHFYKKKSKHDKDIHFQPVISVTVTGLII